MDDRSRAVGVVVLEREHHRPGTSRFGALAEQCKRSSGRREPATTVSVHPLSQLAASNHPSAPFSPADHTTVGVPDPVETQRLYPTEWAVPKRPWMTDERVRLTPTG